MYTSTHKKTSHLANKAFMSKKKNRQNIHNKNSIAYIHNTCMHAETT